MHDCYDGSHCLYVPCYTRNPIKLDDSRMPCTGCDDTHTHTHTHAHIQIFFLCHRTRFYPLALPCLALPCLARSRGPFFTFPPQSLSFLLNPVRRSFIRISHTRSIARRLSCRVYLNCPYAKCACSCARRAPRKRFIRLLRYRLLKLIKTGNRKPRANIGVFFRL